MIEDELIKQMTDKMAEEMDKRIFQLLLKMAKAHNPLEEGLKCFTRQL